MERVRFTTEDLLRLNVVSDAQISPGGQHVAFTISENGTPKSERSPASQVWVQDISGSNAACVTGTPGTNRQPRWSPDSSRLSFLSDREQRGTSQLYLLESAPRDARKLTELPAGVSAHQWSPLGDVIAVVAGDYTPEQDNDVRLFDDDRRFRRLYRVDVPSGETTLINHGDLHVWEFCWSPDGKSLAAIVSDHPSDWGWYSSRLVIIERDTGSVRDLYRPEKQIARPTWSPDGSCIALTTSRWSDPGMTGGDLITVDVKAGAVRNLTSGEQRSHLTAHWTSDGSGLISFAWDHARVQVCHVGLDSGSTPLWTAEAGASDYGCTFDPGSGVVAAMLSTVKGPPEVWVGQVERGASEIEIRALTTSNEPVDLPAIEHQWLAWESSDGRKIEGLYLCPAAHVSATAPPMVTLVHGGPTAAATASFPLAGAAAWTHFLIEAGIAVFMPNYRGSNGYGVEFAESNIGDLGGLDFQDVLTGIDSCVERGLADPDRLGIGGWSYGGYMTAWAVTQTTRFKAAVAGASITNWYSFHGGSNIPGFDSQFIGADPDELDCPYSWTSPLFSCKQVTTPTLFLHGEQDPCCPVGQSYEMFRALRRRGVTTECAVYPREAHGFVEKEHRRDMIERAVGWFSTYLDKK